MAQTVNITFNQSQVDRLIASLNPKQLKSAMFQAIKRTTDFAGRQVKATVKAETFMQPKYVNRVVATRVSKENPPVGIVSISQKMVPLIAFKVRASRRRGVTVQVTKSLPPIVLRHAFKATVRSQQQSEKSLAGHVGIFLRSRHLPTKGPNVGNKRLKLTRRGIAGRLAIEEQFGKSVLSLVETPKIIGSITSEVTDKLEQNVQSQLDRFLK